MPSGHKLIIWWQGGVQSGYSKCVSSEADGLKRIVLVGWKRGDGEGGQGRIEVSNWLSQVLEMPLIVTMAWERPYLLHRQWWCWCEACCEAWWCSATSWRSSRSLRAPLMHCMPSTALAQAKQWWGTQSGDTCRLMPHLCISWPWHRWLLQVRSSYCVLLRCALWGLSAWVQALLFFEIVEGNMLYHLFCFRNELHAGLSIALMLSNMQSKKKICYNYRWEIYLTSLCFRQCFRMR